MTSATTQGLRHYAKLALLIIVSTLFALCFACATPLVAFGTLAALTLPRLQAVAFIIAVWAANQAVGFGLLGYPTDASSYAWGAVLGVASVVSVITAGMTSRRIASGDQMMLLLAPFTAAFVMYQIVLYVAALFIGGMESMTPEIIGWVAVVNALTFAGLMGANSIIASVAPGAALAIRN